MDADGVATIERGVTTVKAYELQSGGGFGDLLLGERPDPVPGPGEVVVRVRAIALNHRDVLVAEGAYGSGVTYPLIPCSDAAGEVVAIAGDVTAVQVGDRVAGTFFQGWLDGPIQRSMMKQDLGGGLDGVLAEFVRLRADGVVRLPDWLSYEAAATLPCAGVTAWHGLMTPEPLRAGETVLIQGTGGVSVFALQFAKLRGARVFLISKSDAKLEKAKAFGAEAGVNYVTTPNWDEVVYDWTEHQGVDHVVEVGGVATLERSLRAVRYGGAVHWIGVLAGAGGPIDPRPILLKSLRVRGIYVGHRRMFLEMLDAIAQAHLSPVIDRVFGFEDATRAMEYLQAGHHFGKVVIRGL